jgi:hypothetical protein
LFNLLISANLFLFSACKSSNLSLAYCLNTKSSSYFKIMLSYFSFCLSICKFILKFCNLISYETTFILVWLSAVSSKYFVIFHETSSFSVVIVLEYSKNLDFVLLNYEFMF